MFVEKHKSGKVNFGERYKNPYTGKWQKVTILMGQRHPKDKKASSKDTSN